MEVYKYYLTGTLQHLCNIILIYINIYTINILPINCYNSIPNLLTLPNIEEPMCDFYKSIPIMEFYIVLKCYIISARSMKMVTDGAYSTAIHNEGEISTIVTPLSAVPFSQIVSLDFKKLRPVNGIGISISGSFGTSHVPVMSAGFKAPGYDWKTVEFMAIGTNASVEIWNEMNHGWARLELCLPGSMIHVYI